MPKVSIIIPNYNHEAFLQQRLDTVFNQTFQDFEVILLDDASTDTSQQLLKNYQEHPKVSHVIINKINSGSPFKQWQKGITVAKGEYVWIAESDDYCELNFLETCIANSNESIGLCYIQSIDVDRNGKKISHRVNYTASFSPNIWESSFVVSGLDFVSKYLVVKNVIPNASAVVFKKSLVTPDFFSVEVLSMKMCGDWLFWILLALKTDVAFVNKDLNFFRHHEQVTRNQKNIARKKQRLLEEFIIRDILEKKEGLVNHEISKSLKTKWFLLHKKEALFTKVFYLRHLTFFKKIMFGYQFVNFKLKDN